MKPVGKIRFIVPVVLAGVTAGASKAGAQDVERAIEPEAVVTAADTFALVIGEERVGTQIVSLERRGDGFVFREKTTSPLGTQTTVVRMTPELAMRSVDQMGTMAGQEMTIQVTYEEGWARGSARVPRRAGVEDVEVQSAVPDYVVDDNALIGLLPGMPLEVGSRTLVSVFQSGRNRLVEYVLTVEDAGSIEVPAGVYPASRVRAESDDSTIVLLVRAEDPHRVLAVEPPGGPLRLVRIGPR